MFSSQVLLIVLAGAATAFTPPGFEPASRKNLTVVFGNTLAVNGKDIPKAETAKAPIVGTSNKLFGTYTLMMVDPDVPPQTAGGPTSEFLHWMQPGLVSARNSTLIAGVQMFELVNPSNVSAFATYIQPSPPNKAPHTHRYTQILLNTTGNSTVLSKLSKFAATRTNFSALNVVHAAGLTVLAGNSFNVTNKALTQSNMTKTSATATRASSKVTRTSTLDGTATSSNGSTNRSTNGSINGSTSRSTNGTIPKSAGGVPNVSDSRVAYIAGLGALAASVMIL